MKFVISCPGILAFSFKIVLPKHIHMKQLLFILTFFFVNYTIAQTIGTKVSLVGVDGKTYTGVITAVQAGKYKVKYDGYDFDAWLTANQFTISQSLPPVPNTRNNNLTNRNNTEQFTQTRQLNRF